MQTKSPHSYAVLALNGLPTSLYTVTNLERNKKNFITHLIILFNCSCMT